MKLFLTMGVLRYNATNKLVMADRSKLPCITGRALVNIIHEQIVRKTLAASLEWMPEFEVVSHKVTALGIPEFKVVTVERLKNRPSKARLYSRAPSSELSPPIVREALSKESKTYVIPQRQAYMEVWTPPVMILKHPDHMRDESPQVHIESIQICPENLRANEPQMTIKMHHSMHNHLPSTAQQPQV